MHGMVDELTSWGHTEEASGHIILKSDNENHSALKDTVGKLLGGSFVLENPHTHGNSQQKQADDLVD